MNIGKKLLSIALCLMLVFGTLAVGTGGFAELLDAVSVKASAAYSVGDTIYYGTYPQTDVTSSLGSVLNSQSGTWKSYGYYSGTGDSSDGQMTASDYMRYIDVTYNGNKYRGVTFDNYRPSITGYISSVSNSVQDDNGYTSGTTYWFKYEPIKWRVLDSSMGLIMSETIINSQPYNNFIIRNETDSHGSTAFWGDNAKTYYASNYAKSSIRQWLNNDFYNTAFSDEQKSNIKTTTLNNDCYATLNGKSSYEEYDAPSTNDKVFLLSWDEVTNCSYGFDSSDQTSDTARKLKGSDYAKCQGLSVYNSSGSEYDGNSDYWLRSPHQSSGNACLVISFGIAYSISGVDGTYGICPALQLQNLKSDYAGSEIEDTFSAKLNAKSSTTVDYRSKVNITATASGVPDGYFLAIYSGNTLLEKGTKDKVTYTPKESNNKPAELKSDVTYTVKVIDGKNAVQKDSNGKDLAANVEIRVKQGFFDKLIAFFKGLFGLLPTVEIKP